MNQMTKLKTAAEMKQIRADAVKEDSIERHFMKRAKQYGCRQRKLTQYYAEDGWPDRLLVWRDGKGTTDFCELKRPKGGKPEPRQNLIRQDLIACGAVATVLHTKELVDMFFASRAKELGVKPVVPLTMRRAALLSANEF